MAKKVAKRVVNKKSTKRTRKPSKPALKRYAVVSGDHDIAWVLADNVVVSDLRLCFFIEDELVGCFLHWTGFYFDKDDNAEKT